MCDGAGRSRRARVRYVDDRISELRYTYVPSMTTEVETALDERLAAAGALPSCLRFDAEGRETGGPYRSGAQEPAFFGYRFGDAFGRAVTAIGGLGGQAQLLRQEAVTYARPILWLRYRMLGEHREAVLGVGAGGEPFGIVAR
jgi:hypothetical protein